MHFNSLEFAVFLPIVFFLYWFICSNNLKAQNVLLLIASYVFYGWWDWRLLSLLIVLSLVNYLAGIKIEKNAIKAKKKIWFVFSLITNIGVLIAFKYFNFFIDGFLDLISVFGYDLSRTTTKVIIPLGISFYVFLSLSYVIDIYKQTLHSSQNVIEVLLSLSFFPIILAGPIQRPSALLPQISNKRLFNYAQAVDGLKQILWGLFMKVVLADNLSVFVNDFFINYSIYSGSTLLLGAVFYTFQIYADFSGYSDIAVGTAKLFGFNLMRNFAYPYFSQNISEFWKRWHISLTIWFRDYIFLPLSFILSGRIGNREFYFVKSDIFIYIVASTVVWFLTGLWHGANSTFIVWGLIHGLLLIVYRLTFKRRLNYYKKFEIIKNNRLVKIFGILVTFLFVLFAWVFFKAESIGHAMNYLSGIFSHSFFMKPDLSGKPMAIISIVLIFGVVIVEWLGRGHQYAIAALGFKWPKSLRYLMYFALIATIFIFHGHEEHFIYFQF